MVVRNWCRPERQPAVPAALGWSECAAAPETPTRPRLLQRPQVRVRTRPRTEPADTALPVIGDTTGFAVPLCTIAAGLAFSLNVARTTAHVTVGRSGHAATIQASVPAGPVRIMHGEVTHLAVRGLRPLPEPTPSLTDRREPAMTAGGTGLPIPPPAPPLYTSHGLPFVVFFDRPRLLERQDQRLVAGAWTLRAVAVLHLDNLEQFAAGVTRRVAYTGGNAPIDQIRHEGAHEVGEIVAGFDALVSDRETSRFTRSLVKNGA